MIKAVIVENIDLHLATPGAVEIRSFPDGRGGGIAFVCPCGCGREGYLPVEADSHGPSWDWGGNHEQPTLTPLVLFRGGCEWHGYLTQGEWRSC